MDKPVRVRIASDASYKRRLTRKTEIDYPAEDGKPLAETETHLDEILSLREVLRRFFKSREDVYVSSNHLIYLTEGDIHHRVAPDVYVVFGGKKHDANNAKRRVFKLWEEKCPPAVVFEVSSRKTIRKDLGSKKDVYARIGVKEYYLYDPENRSIIPALQGFELTDGKYQPIYADSEGSIVSRAMGLKMRLENGLVRLFDVKSDERMLRPEEEILKIAADLNQRDAEIARLREELARLKNTQS